MLGERGGECEVALMNHYSNFGGLAEDGERGAW